jgi:lysyl-tRNA synthetase class 2
LANAFDELNDWREQVRRIEQSNQIKRQLGLPPFPVDREFIENLQFGLPPSSGIAMGIERLFMMLMGKSRLSDILVFAHDSESSS